MSTNAFWEPMIVTWMQRASILRAPTAVSAMKASTIPAPPSRTPEETVQVDIMSFTYSSGVEEWKDIDTLGSWHICIPQF